MSRSSVATQKSGFRYGLHKLIICVISFTKCWTVWTVTQVRLTDRHETTSQQGVSHTWVSSGLIVFGFPLKTSQERVTLETDPFTWRVRAVRPRNLHVFKGPDDFNGYGYFYVRLYWTGFGLPANIVEEWRGLRVAKLQRSF